MGYSQKIRFDPLNEMSAEYRQPGYLLTVCGDYILAILTKLYRQQLLDLPDA
jgi:hypothetical protein